MKTGQTKSFQVGEKTENEQGKLTSDFEYQISRVMLEEISNLQDQVLALQQQRSSMHTKIIAYFHMLERSVRLQK